MMQKNDPLLRYVEALDRGDFDALERLLQQVQEQGESHEFDMAISGLHVRFDSQEDFTAQLMRVRKVS
jgi:hypothetical protein